MSDTTLEILISSRSRALSAAENSLLREKLQAYLETLVNAAEIPVDPVVVVREDESLDDESIQLRFGSRSVRVYVRPMLNAGLDDLADRIADGLFRGRCLLVSTDAVNRLWSRWKNAELVREQYLRVWIVREAMRLGLKVSLIESVLAEQQLRIRSLDGAQQLFEKAFIAKGAVRIALSQELHDRWIDPQTGAYRSSTTDGLDLPAQLSLLADGLFEEKGMRFGIPLPTVGEHCAPHGFQLWMNDLPMPPRRGLQPGEFLVDAPIADLKRHGIDAQAAINPNVRGEAGIATGLGTKRDCERAGFRCWDADGYLALHVADAARSHSGMLMSESIWSFYQALIYDRVPLLISELKQDLWQMVRTLRILLEESISIRNMDTILEALCARPEILKEDTSRYIVFSATGGLLVPSQLCASREELSPEILAEILRVDLKRYISHIFSRGGNKLNVYLIAPELEVRAGAIDGARYSIGDGEEFCEAARKVIRMSGEPGKPVAILTTLPCRRQLRRMFELEFPHIPVLSYQELSPDTQLDPLARIT